MNILKLQDKPPTVTATPTWHRAAKHRRVATVLTSFFVLCTLLCLVSESHALPFVIDDFTDPNPLSLDPVTGDIFVIGGFSADPKLIKQDSVLILGGQRDVLVDVKGTPQPVSASGVIGEGVFIFNSSEPATTVTLQYDGTGTIAGGDDVNGPPAALTMNPGGLPDPTDITVNGQKMFRLSFLSTDAGPLQSSFEATIRVSARAGGEAEFIGQVMESTSPSSFLAEFQDFIPTGGFDLNTSFGDVDSIEIVLNSSELTGVDFRLTAIETVPEPASWGLALLGFSLIFRRGTRKARRALSV